MLLYVIFFFDTKKRQWQRVKNYLKPFFDDKEDV